MKEVPNSNKRTKQRWMFGTMTDNDEVWFTWLLMAGGSGWGRGRTKTYIMCGGIGWKCRISWQIPNLFFFFFHFLQFTFIQFWKKQICILVFTENSIFFLLFLWHLFLEEVMHTLKNISRLWNHFTQYILTRHCHFWMSVLF